MPMASKRPCLRPGCGELVVKGYCPTHQRAATRLYDDSRGNSTQRGYGGTWRRFRAAYLRRHPLCESDKGCNDAATEPHHIRRVAAGGPMYDEDNLQALCKPHHSALRGCGGRG